jgi:hypothetical protein
MAASCMCVSIDPNKGYLQRRYATSEPLTRVLTIGMLVEREKPGTAEMLATLREWSYRASHL